VDPIFPHLPVHQAVLMKPPSSPLSCKTLAQPEGLKGFLNPTIPVAMAQGPA